MQKDARFVRITSAGLRESCARRDRDARGSQLPYELSLLSSGASRGWLGKLERLWIRERVSVGHVLPVQDTGHRDLYLLSADGPGDGGRLKNTSGHMAWGRMLANVGSDGVGETFVQFESGL